MSDKATPRPWRRPGWPESTNLMMAGDVRPYAQPIGVSGDSSQCAVANAYGETAEQATANADLIVRAVNCHDELVAACEAAASIFREHNPQSPSGMLLAARQCTNALAKAKGQTDA